MENAKLINLLKTLNSREVSRFEEYVHSPYFNKHEQTKKLCSYLVALAPDFEQPRKLQKQKIHQHIYPKKPYDNAQINRLTSTLLQLLHDFLVSERLHNQNMALEHQLLLLEEFRKRKVEKDYQHALKQYERLSENLLLETPDAYLYQYRYHKELDAHFIEQGGRQFDENLQLKNQHFDTFFILEKLRLSCDMVNRNIIVRSNYQTTLLDQVLTYTEKKELAAIPSVKIYKSILKMRLADAPEDEEHYLELKNLLGEYATGFAKGELMDVYGYVLNHCAKKINEGQTHYYQEVLQAYKYLVDSQTIYVDGYLPFWDYKNIVTVALRVQEFEWALQFIETHKKNLVASVRENMYRYNLSAYYYTIKDYGKALQSLHNVEFTDPSYYFGAKTIQMKCYYALQEEEALGSLLEAFSTYLHRHKELSEYWKQSNLNTLKFAKQIQKLRMRFDFIRKKQRQDQLQKLRTGIQNTSPIANKDWLLECIEGLEVEI